MTSERTQEMARAYVEGGLSYSQIAAEYGLTRQRVGQILGPLNLAQPLRSQSRIAREQRLRAAYERIEKQGSTMKEEAESLGYSDAASLRSVLYKMGLRVTDKRVTPAHGTVSRYRSKSEPCRCDECRRANREYNASLKDREAPNHGTYSGYINYACRCDACREAHRIACRAQRAARRRRKEVNA